MIHHTQTEDLILFNLSGVNIACELAKKVSCLALCRDKVYTAQQDSTILLSSVFLAPREYTKVFPMKILL